MRFFHLSDLHIGLRLMNYDLREDQEYILKQIVDRAREEQPDAVVIAGDIYDKAIPSAEAVDLFDDFVSALVEALPQAEIMAISGNHDSTSRVNLFRHVLKKQRIHMIGFPPVKPEEHIEKVTLADASGAVNFYLLPFVKPSMVKLILGPDENGNNLSYDESVRRMIAREEINPGERNILVSHQFYLPSGQKAEDIDRMESEVVTVGNIDQVSADVLSVFDYAALGHIHKPMKVGSEFYRYCGTPLACSISEEGQQKGIILVEMGSKGDMKTSVLPLTPLRRVRTIRGYLKDVLPQACEDYVRVVLTDPKDLNLFDMQDRVRLAFPNLLEIRREIAAGPDTPRKRGAVDAEKDPFSLCCDFMKDLDEEEMELLRDVINKVQGVEA